MSLVSVNGSRPDSRMRGAMLGIGPRRQGAHGVRDGADVVRRRAAAAADDVDEPLACEFGDLFGHEFGALVVLAEGVGQAGVRIGADDRVGDVGNLLQMLAHGGSRRARN